MIIQAALTVGIVVISDHKHLLRFWGCIRIPKFPSWSGLSIQTASDKSRAKYVPHLQAFSLFQGTGEDVGMTSSLLKI